MTTDLDSSGYNAQLSKEWADWIELGDGKNRDRLFSRIKNWIKNTNPRTIADLGCGQGACYSLVNREIEYTGIDLSQDLIEKANKRFKQSNAKFMCGNVYDLPLQRESVDAVMSIWVWSHLTDLLKASQEMHRVLKPGGSFLIITANPDTYEIRKTYYKEFKEYGNYLVGTFDLGEGKYLTDTTLQFHTRKYMLESLASSVLTVEDVETFGNEEDDPRGMYIEIKGHK